MSYHSLHTFMFPFQWDYIKNKHNNTYEDRTNLKDFHKLISENSPDFKLTPFSIDKVSTKYNEFTYFHQYVRDTIYYTHENDILRYYEIEKPDGEYNIEYLDKDENGNTIKKTFFLTLNNICLHVYNTGVGIISFNLTNNKYSDKKSILYINEYGRRLYPQFMDDKDPLYAKNTFLANRIWGKIGNINFDDDFNIYKSAKLKVESTFLPPKHILSVFGYKPLEQVNDINKKIVFTKAEEKQGVISIRKITDDRMFFLSYYNNAKKVDSLAKTQNKIPEQLYKYELDGFWYAYLFGDKNEKNISVKNLYFQREEVIRHTYTRWLNKRNLANDDASGTLFGISRDSFVSLGAWDKIGTDMQTMYYQMAILCLTQRATILRFNREISIITSKVFYTKNDSKKVIKDLYEDYICFINQIYFREVTSQIQGIEIYAMFQKVMNIEKEIKDLDNEMQELFNYLSVQEQSFLSKIAHDFLPISVVIGFFSLAILNPKLFNKPLAEIELPEVDLALIFSTIILLWLLYLLFKYIVKKNKN